MSQDLNNCQFIGRLGRDPETRYTPTGDAVCNFSIAVGESWKDKASGEKQERTEWVRCVAFGKLGEIAGQYLVKGKQCYVSGRMSTRKWTDKDGSEKYSTEIKVDQLQLLGGNEGARDQQERPAAAAAQRTAAPPQRAAPSPRPAAAHSFSDMDDDIAF